MTVAQAAAKWGVSARRAQVLLREGRVKGATRLGGHAWLIPGDAEKPGDPRRARRTPSETLHAELEVLSATLEDPRGLPWDNPDVAAATVADPSMRMLCEGWLAYLRGDFDGVKRKFQSISDGATRLYASSLAAAAATSTGDWALLRDIQAHCREQAAAGGLAGSIAEWAATNVNTGAHVPNMIPDWVKNGDFGHLPVQLRWDALYRHARWLHHEKKTEAALAAARVGLSFYDRAHGITSPGVYLRISAAMACSQMGRLDKAREYLAEVMDDCMPLGFITPFAENSPHLGGLAEQVAGQKYPALCAAMEAQARQTIPNWMEFHNRHAKKHVTPLLSPREYQIAKVAVSGATRREIAERFHLSPGTVKNEISRIYQTLFISGKNRKEQLARHIL
ncbi:MAG: LuxR C-terminal-related transcriptional regulator [Kiritimatiellaeota bacterium]|nr:LuxR C-terminal-related transcriptional regulator [Kiritimatiellota bacterium]